MERDALIERYAKKIFGFACQKTQNRQEAEDLSQSMENVVAARILRLRKHPDADKLQLCDMDVGSGTPIQIITGADNVFEGALVPAALHDSRLPNGTHIKRGKLRGLPSEGMLCSGEELCLGEADYPGAEVDGILILREDAAPGTDMREILGLDDVIIDFKITANRPDCQSILGLAREVSAVLNKPLKMPDLTYHADKSLKTTEKLLVPADMRPRRVLRRSPER